MADAAGGGWREYSQHEDLTTRLRNILHEYPSDTGPFREFLQNADDAGAEEFAILVDWAEAAAEPPPGTASGLLSSGLAKWQGPAIYFYNNTVFSDEDFASLASLGLSGKRADSSKIGKFGLGFNVAYHYSDIVSFVTRDQVVFFDPHARDLPEGVPGLRASFVDDNWRERFPAQLRNFAWPELGCHLLDGQPLDGTLFRLPLRRADHPPSLISDTRFPRQTMDALLEEFAAQAPETLLFLKTVTSIAIYERSQAGQPAVLRYRVDSQRRPWAQALGSRQAELQRRTTYHDMSIRPWCADASLAPAPLQHQQWLTHAGVHSKEAAGQARALHCSADVSVAVCLGKGEAAEGAAEGGAEKAAAAAAASAPLPVAGRAYCYLPLPILSGLPVHVNGSFALSSNRRALWSGEGHFEESSSAKSKWNAMLLEQALPAIYAELLGGLVCLGSSVRRQQECVYAFWPRPRHAHSPFADLARATLNRLRDTGAGVFWDDIGSRWCALGSIVLRDASLPTCPPALIQALHSQNIRVVTPPAFLRESLDDADVPYRTATVRLVTDGLRTAKLDRPTVDALLGFVLHDPSPQNFKALHGMEVVPLTGGRLGVLTKPPVRKWKKGDATLRNAYFAHPNMAIAQRLMPTCPQLVDAASPAFALLSSRTCFDNTNIAPLTLDVAAHLLPYALPSDWHGQHIVAVGEPNGGNGQDRQGGRSVTRAVARGVSKKAEKQRAKDRANVRAHASALKDTCPPDLGRKEAFERLALLWQLIDEAGSGAGGPGGSMSEALAEWPIVPTHQGFVLTLEYARIRMVLHADAFAPPDLALMAKVGCLFCSLTGAMPTAAELLALEAAEEDEEEEEEEEESGGEESGGEEGEGEGNGAGGEEVVGGGENGKAGADGGEAAAQATVTEYRTLRQLVDARMVDAVRALARSYEHDFHKLERSECLALRDMLLRWDDMTSGPDVRIELLQSLPVFDTLGRQAMVPATQAWATPHDEYDTWSWEETLAPCFPNQLLHIVTPSECKIARLGRVKRPTQADFLLHFLIGNMSADMPEGVVMRAMEACHLLVENSPNWVKKEAKQALQTLRSVPLVSDSEGGKHRAAEFYDPDDELLTAIFGSEELETRWPPRAYRAPGVLSVLRIIGLQNLSLYPCFRDAAMRVAATKSVAHGRALAEFLVQHQHKLTWTATELHMLGPIRFLPALDLRAESLPFPGVGLPANPYPDPQHAQGKGKGKGGKSAGGTINSARRGEQRSARNMRSMLEEELQAALDMDDLDNTSDRHWRTALAPFHVARRGLALLTRDVRAALKGGEEAAAASSAAAAAASSASAASSAAAAAAAAADEDIDEASSNLNAEEACTRFGGVQFVSLNGAGVQGRHAWLQWKQRPILPSTLDHLSANFATRVGLRTQADIPTLFLNIRSAVAHWETDGAAVPPRAVIAARQACVLLWLAELLNLLKRSVLQPSAISQALNDVPVVVTDDGECVLARSVCVDLEEDVAEKVRAVPEYLQGLEELLVVMGSASTAAMRAPPVKLRAPVPAADLLPMLQSQFNVPDLADIRFVVEGKTIYAHKLVLALTCPTFHCMFTSGMRETVTVDALADDSDESVMSARTTKVEIPTDVDHNAFLAFLRYLYTGEVCEPGFLHPPSEESCAMVCSLLQLSDLYDVTHLKEWCEVYLSDRSIAGLYNICDLLTHAEACNARQMAEFLYYIAREMLAVVTKMEQWERLPEELREKILSVQ